MITPDTPSFEFSFLSLYILPPIDTGATGDDVGVDVVGAGLGNGVGSFVVGDEVVGSGEGLFVVGRGVGCLVDGEGVGFGVIGANVSTAGVAKLSPQSICKKSLDAFFADVSNPSMKNCSNGIVSSRSSLSLSSSSSSLEPFFPFLSCFVFRCIVRRPTGTVAANVWIVDATDRQRSNVVEIFIINLGIVLTICCSLRSI